MGLGLWDEWFFPLLSRWSLWTRRWWLRKVGMSLIITNLCVLITSFAQVFSRSLLKLFNILLIRLLVALFHHFFVFLLSSLSSLFIEAFLFNQIQVLLRLIVRPFLGGVPLERQVVMPSPSPSRSESLLFVDNQGTAFALRVHHGLLSLTIRWCRILGHFLMFLGVSVTFYISWMDLTGWASWLMCAASACRFLWFLAHGSDCTWWRLLAIVSLLEVTDEIAHLGKFPLELHLVILKRYLKLDIILSRCTSWRSNDFTKLLSGPRSFWGVRFNFSSFLSFVERTVAKFHGLGLLCQCPCLLLVNVKLLLLSVLVMKQPIFQ